MVLARTGYFVANETKKQMKRLDDQSDDQVEQGRFSGKVKTWCGIGFIVVGLSLLLTVVLMAKAGYSMIAVIGAAIPFMLIKIALAVVGALA